MAINAYDRLIAITISKNYSTELSFVLDANAKFFDKWFIVTQEDDEDTINLIKSKNLSNIEIVYYPLVPDDIKSTHAKSPLRGKDAHFSYPQHLSRLSGKLLAAAKKNLELKFDKGGALRTIQQHYLPKENATSNDLILLLDSDILLPENFLDIINTKTFRKECLYGATRKDFLFYSDYVNDINSKPYSAFELAGFVHLYLYDSTKLCKRTHDCGWVDFEFKLQFGDIEIFDDVMVSHLGASGVNWSGKEVESFIVDKTTDDLRRVAKEFQIEETDSAELIRNQIRLKISIQQIDGSQRKYHFPTAIFPGFQKCGSTSLKLNLLQHTNIEFAHGFNTELNYCANEKYFPSSWNDDHMWYLRHFQRDGNVWMDHCNTLFNIGWKKSIDRMRTTYVAKLFKNTKRVKFVVMVRNPITRAFAEYNHYMEEFPASYSWYWDNPGMSFLENVKGELANIKELSDTSDEWYMDDESMHGRFVVGGMYSHVLSHFKKELELDEETLKVVALERLVASPEKTFKEIFEFIGCEYQDINLKKYNSFKGVGKIDDESVSLLSEFYKPFNEQLYEFLGYEIDEWNK